MLEQNVGGRDRQLRAFGVLLAVASAAVAWELGTRTVAQIALLVAAGLAFNVITGFCWANKLLGIDSCSRPPATEDN
jgi:hypothetical protein